jgi:hypothetical protein
MIAGAALTALVMGPGCELLARCIAFLEKALA